MSTTTISQLSFGSVINPVGGSLGDGSQVPQLVGRGGDALVSEVHGKYYHMAYRGNLFSCKSVGAGVAIPIFSATAQTYAFLNPAGSGVNFELLRADIISLSATEVVSAPVLSFATGAPLAVILGGTCTPVSGGIVNTLAGAGNNSKGTLYSAVTTVAQTNLWTVALGGFTQVSYSANIHYDIDGAVLVPPGTMGIMTSLIAATQVCAVQLMWAEVPI